MTELNVKQKNIANQLRQLYPELKSYSDEQILSLYNQQLNNIQLSEAEKISIMSDKNKVGNDGMGLRLENSERSVSKEQETQLKSALTARLNAVSTNVKKAEDSNGVIGSIWSWSKNNIPFLNKITDSSDKVRKQQKADLKALESGNIAEAFKQITGLDYTLENVNKFLNNEVQTKSETALNGYKEGQTMALDVGADMISGILAVGALALAPVTGEASLLLAAGVGAATKVTIKALAPGEYSMKDLTYDSITGSINGALAPITNGLGGAAGTGIAKFFGLEALESTAKTALSQAVKQAGKEVVEEVAEETVKQGGKSLLTKILAKQGSEYVLKEGAEKTLKTTVGKVAAYAVDMMVDGSLSGAGDGFARALAEGRFEDIPQDMLQGFIGGAIASPFIGGGFRLVGNASSTVLNKINNKITFSSVLPDGTSTKFGQGQIGDCPLLSMIDGFLANDRTKSLLTNAIQTDVNGNFAVKIGDKTVTVLRSSLSDEMLADQSGIRIFEQAYKQIAGDLDGGFADVVAKHFGLNPLHITSDNITDEVLEKIAKDSDNYVLSLGARINADGVVTPDGEFQHYFSIKNIDTKTKTVTLVDTYDTSKTLTMSFDDVKTQGISIDGGSVGKTDLPNSVRNADDVKFRGDGPEALKNKFYSKDVEDKLKSLMEKYGIREKHFGKDTFANFDYEHADLHLKNLQQFLEIDPDSSACMMRCMQKFYSSKEGGEAFEYILSICTNERDIASMISLPPESILRAKSLELTDLRDIDQLCGMEVAEFYRWKNSEYKDRLSYVSSHKDINELFLKFKNYHANFKKYDELILIDIANNPSNEREILRFYENFFSSLRYEELDINEVLRQGKLDAYKKAYKYLVENKIENVLVRVIDMKEEAFWEKSVSLDKSVLFFDENGNFIRTDKLSDKLTYSEVNTSSKKMHYSAETEEYINLKTSGKTVCDNNGNLIYTEKYQKNDLGKFDIIREYPNGRIDKIGLAEITSAGDIVIEKTLISDTGIKTDYLYVESPNGSRMNYTKIIGKNGFISENRYQYKVLSENHFKTIENGLEYDIKYLNNEVIVTRGDGKQVKIDLGNNGKSVLSKDLLSLLKNMPGSFYFDIDRWGLKQIALEHAYKPDKATYSPYPNKIELSNYFKDNIFVLMHEFGHYRDNFLNIKNNVELLKIYEQELKDLMDNASALELANLNYFINPEAQKKSNYSLGEVIAETNAFLYANNIEPQIELRGQFLQQYFPKTFSMILEILKNH